MSVGEGKNRLCLRQNVEVKLRFADAPIFNCEGGMLNHDEPVHCTALECQNDIWRYFTSVSKTQGPRKFFTTQPNSSDLVLSTCRSKRIIFLKQHALREKRMEMTEETVLVDLDPRKRVNLTSCSLEFLQQNQMR